MPMFGDTRWWTFHFFFLLLRTKCSARRKNKIKNKINKHWPMWQWRRRKNCAKILSFLMSENWWPVTLATWSLATSPAFISSIACNLIDLIKKRTRCLFDSVTSHGCTLHNMFSLLSFFLQRTKVLMKHVIHLPKVTSRLQMIRPDVNLAHSWAISRKKIIK